MMGYSATALRRHRRTTAAASVRLGYDIGTEIRPDHAPTRCWASSPARNAGPPRQRDVLDVDAIERAAAAVAEAGRVHLFAEWGDIPAMRELHMRLLRIGVPAWFHESPQEAGLAVSTLLREGDVLLLGNRSGESDAAVTLAKTMRETAGTTIALHGDPGSRLARTVHIPLFTGIRNGSVWTQYFAGRASDTLVSSLLWVLVAQRRTRDAAISFLDTSILFEHERHEA